MGHNLVLNIANTVLESVKNVIVIIDGLLQCKVHQHQSFCHSLSLVDDAVAVYRCGIGLVLQALTHFKVVNNTMSSDSRVVLRANYNR